MERPSVFVRKNGGKKQRTLHGPECRGGRWKARGGMSPLKKRKGFEFVEKGKRAEERWNKNAKRRPRRAIENLQNTDLRERQAL